MLITKLSAKVKSSFNKTRRNLNDFNVTFTENE